MDSPRSYRRDLPILVMGLLDVSPCGSDASLCPGQLRALLCLVHQAFIKRQFVETHVSRPTLEGFATLGRGLVPMR